MIERLFRSGAPFDWRAQASGHFAEIFEGPAFFAAAGERMDHSEISLRRGRDGNPRDPFLRRRERGEEREGKTTDGFAKLGTVGSVPGVDRIEGFELRDAGVFYHAQKIEACVGDGSGAVGEADQRKHGTRGPDFGVSGAGGFECGQRQDDVADGAGSNEKAACDRRQDRLSYSEIVRRQNRLSYWREILTGSTRSTVLGGRHMRSSQA